LAAYLAISASGIVVSWSGASTLAYSSAAALALSSSIPPTSV
jgi:hypothetical protein